jgi:DNA sulfur modification protein DndE
MTKNWGAPTLNKDTLNAMKPPVDTVRISSKGKDILTKMKRRLGVERWNEVCRVALCRSLANPTKPTKPRQGWDSAIEIEWKTFGGEYADILTGALRVRALKDDVDIRKKEFFVEYFRAHLERGVSSLQNVNSFEEYLTP